MRSMMTLVVVAAMLALAPVAQAQYRPNPPEGWTGLALRNAQNVPTALFANMDMALCESSAVHGRGGYSESCGRLMRRYQTGQIDRLYSDAARARFFSGTQVFEPGYYAGGYGGSYGGGYYPSSYGHSGSYGPGGRQWRGTPPINGGAGIPGYGGYSQQYGYPTYGSYGIGPYDDFNGYGAGYLDYYGGDWTYHTRRGRHHLATQNNVNAWGIANTALNAGHLVYDIVQTRKQNRRLDEINEALMALEQQRYAPQPVPVSMMAPVQQPVMAPSQSGTAVVNQTGCDLLLKERDGRLTRVRANQSALILDAEGFVGKTVDGRSCNIIQQVTADGSAVVLTCR